MIQAPANVAASTHAAPISDASRTFPCRNRYMYQPTNSAIGMVAAIVNVPHELPGTSRCDFSGRIIPGPSGLLLSRKSPGTASWNDS